MIRKLVLFYGLALAYTTTVRASTLIDPVSNSGISECLYCDGYPHEQHLHGFGTVSGYGATAIATGSDYAGLTMQAASAKDESVSAGGFIRYSYRVNGPDLGLVNVLVSFNLEVQASGTPGTDVPRATGRGFAALTVYGETANGATFDCYSDNCSSYSQHSGFFVTAEPGMEYEIELDAEAFGGDGGSGFAFVDPLLTIDPTTPNASQYSVELSSGIANALSPVGATPEPGSVALMGLGVAVLAAGRALTRQKLQRAVVLAYAGLRIALIGDSFDVASLNAWRHFIGHQSTDCSERTPNYPAAEILRAMLRRWI